MLGMIASALRNSKSFEQVVTGSTKKRPSSLTLDELIHEVEQGNEMATPENNNEEVAEHTNGSDEDEESFVSSHSPIVERRSFNSLFKFLSKKTGEIPNLFNPINAVINRTERQAHSVQLTPPTPANSPVKPEFPGVKSLRISRSPNSASASQLPGTQPAASQLPRSGSGFKFSPSPDQKTKDDTSLRSSSEAKAALRPRPRSNTTRILVMHSPKT
eukprot:TRINITY_DN7034_c0_g1_i1.p1 TRINITY_DN7034_c0_g1~~TRINITY_DN7034_c0_g1_i1.p1  ORF type:complete len:216 (-),score=54.18 TRINITY_DN7034_c0_g1_i1:40-687(-)